MSSPTRMIFYPFVEGAALHEEGSHRLWVLNHSSAVLWCLYEEHGPGDRLVAAYADHFDLSLGQARADVDNALAEFVQTGLLSKFPVPSPQFPAPRSQPEKSPNAGTKPTNLPVSPGRSLPLMLMLQRNGLTVSFILRLTWPQRTCTTTLSRALLVGC